jgi:hypothetical protein
MLSMLEFASMLSVLELTMTKAMSRSMAIPSYWPCMPVWVVRRMATNFVSSIGCCCCPSCPGDHTSESTTRMS